MRTFSNAPRFEPLPDGTFYARAGVQTNCAGIAGIHVRIRPTPSGEITCSVPALMGSEIADNGSAVPGAAVPAMYRDAVFEGARTAFDKYSGGIGIRFELIDALVHPVDANELRFKAAGITALNGWLECNAQHSQDEA